MTTKRQQMSIRFNTLKRPDQGKYHRFCSPPLELLEAMNDAEIVSDGYVERSEGELHFLIGSVAPNRWKDYNRIIQRGYVKTPGNRAYQPTFA